MQMSDCTTSLEVDQQTRPASPPAGDLMAVVVRYQGPLLRYVGRMLGVHDSQTEDVVQETFVRLHRQVCTHGADSVRHLTTWLFQVAHNLTLDVLRQKARRQNAGQACQDPASVAAEQAVDDLDALGEAIRQEARQVALRELGELDELHRQVILLKVVQGMTLRQVAEVVGVSITTVNYRLNEGLGMLARRLRRAGVV
jgi:RNA polymerase sigma-70 factor (ECF subfamily)